MFTFCLAADTPWQELSQTDLIRNKFLKVHIYVHMCIYFEIFATKRPTSCFLTFLQQKTVLQIQITQSSLREECRKKIEKKFGLLPNLLGPHPPWLFFGGKKLPPFFIMLGTISTINFLYDTGLFSQGLGPSSNF